MTDCPKSSDGLHRFPYVGADCVWCRQNQYEISGQGFRKFGRRFEHVSGEEPEKIDGKNPLGE